LALNTGDCLIEVTSWAGLIVYDFKIIRLSSLLTIRLPGEIYFRNM
jgi:hypothetical protein